MTGSRFASLETAPARSSPAAGGAPLKDAAYYMGEGLRAELAGDQEKALNHYSAALGENPLLVEAWAAQLWMLLYLDEPAEACLWADRALEPFPNQPDVLALKSLALARCGLAEEAREMNDAALIGGRESENLWLTRGALQLDAGGPAAAACFQHALAVAGRKELAELRVADLFLAARRFAEAEERYRAAAARLPEAAWLWFGYGRAWRGLGQEEHARHAFARAARLAPSDGRYSQALSRRGGLRARVVRWLARKFSPAD